MTNDFVLSPRVKADCLVHIVDEDPATCESLSLLFRLEGFETAFSLDADHFFFALSKRVPDLVVTEINMRDTNGVSLLRRAREQCHGLPFIGLTKLARLDAVVAAMKDGAIDVVSKPVDHEMLLTQVRGALSKNVHLSAVSNRSRKVTIGGFTQLTPRERQVLELIANGRSNKLAARELGISDRTVEVHRSRVMEKLFARNTADLMRIVLSN